MHSIGKTWAALPAALVLAALALSAGAPASLAAQQEVVAPDSAVHFVGKTVTIRGVVSGVHTSRGGTIFLDFGARYPRNTFTAVIFSSSASRFPNASAWEGKTLRVTGEVKLYRGKPEIVVDEPGQVAVDTTG